MRRRRRRRRLQGGISFRTVHSRTLSPARLYTLAFIIRHIVRAISAFRAPPGRLFAAPTLRGVYTCTPLAVHLS